MNLKAILCVAMVSAALLPGVANAKGCLKGAAVGAVGGHVAGHHAVLGAAAGCAVGHHMANKTPANPPAVQQTSQPKPAAPAKT